MNVLSLDLRATKRITINLEGYEFYDYDSERLIP